LGRNRKKELSMTLRWTDVRDIAIALDETYPDVDVVNLRFTDLWTWVQQLPDFDDDPQRSNEKVLEAIQMAWLDERS
jgi:FeS assembly protein IscX